MGRFKRIRHFPGVEENASVALKAIESNVSDVIDETDRVKRPKLTPRVMVGDVFSAQPWDLVYVTAAGRVVLPKPTVEMVGSEVVIAIAKAVSVDVSASASTVNGSSSVTISGIRSKAFTATEGGWLYDA